jgi:hypothetical protein
MYACMFACMYVCMYVCIDRYIFQRERAVLSALRRVLRVAHILAHVL